MIRVLILASSEIVRAGLESLLSGNPALSVVGSSLEVDKLAPLAEELEPEVILVEQSTEEFLPTLFEFTGGTQASPVVLLFDDREDHRMAEALRSGVRALLPREATGSEIVAAIEAVTAGLVVLHPSATDLLLPALQPFERAVPPSPNQALTPREVEVLTLIAEGLGNKEIAWRMGISEHTVKFHIASLFSKLNVSSRTEAVTSGIRQGLILL